MISLLFSQQNHIFKVRFLFFLFLMQLFICHDLQIQGTTLKIRNNPELVRQLRKVLRAQAGYEFFVQTPPYHLRYRLSLQSWTDSEVLAEIVEKIPAPDQEKKIGMAIALPNKQEKLELIVQKLTEI